MDRRTVLAGSGAAVVALHLPLPPRGTIKNLLWYDAPGADWESQALPVGNGSLGASLLGGVATDRILLNEKTLWTGGPGSPGYDFGNWREPRPGAVAQIQQAIDERVRLAPEEVAAVLGQPRNAYGSYQPLGDLVIETGHTGQTGYRRDLDLATGVASVRYDLGGVRHTREYLASHPHRAIVVRLGADRPGQVSARIALDVAGESTLHGNTITVDGVLADNGLRYQARALVIADGGVSTPGADASITVSGAHAVHVIVTAATDYAGAYPDYRGPAPRAELPAETSWERLRRAHVHDHGELFGRVELDLGAQLPAGTPTDRLLAAYRGDDPALESLFFQYGRYLLIASSRTGSPLPANLQGVWNPYPSAPWSADYHVNINLQMNYWPAHTTNLSETVAPLVDFVDALREPGAVTAREMFGAGGWVLHNESNPFGFTGVHDWPTAFWFPESAAWLVRHLHEHYLFTLDERFLRERAYPLMREVARFWLDELHTDPRDGTLVVSPSYSPEHGDFSAGASMSQQIVHDLFVNTLQAAAVVGDRRTSREVKAALDRLDPGTRIGSWSQLQEWKSDWDDPADDHRHVSHLYALHPGRQITPAGTPELAAAAEVSLRARGDGGTGWSKAWKINFWARLHDGDHAHLMLSEQLRTSTLANLWDTHPPFQIDGNFGATAGVAEMLVQSHDGVIDVLPALPSAWPDGTVTGLRARGDLTIGVRWARSRIREITIAAGHGGRITLRNPVFGGDYRLSGAVPAPDTGDTCVFTARAGGRYVITAG